MRKISLLVILFVFCVGSRCFASGPQEDAPKIRTQVDKEKVEFGGRINVELLAENNKEFQFIFPKDPKETGDFSLIRSYPIKSGKYKNYGNGMGYIMGVYSSGTHVIPPIMVQYRKSGDPKIYKTYSRQIPVEVTTLLTSQDKDIKDIKGLIYFYSHFKLLFILISVFLIAGVASAIFFWLKRKKEKEGSAIKGKLPPHEIAYMELRRLRSRKLHEKGQVKEYFTVLSDILRKYIEGRFSYNAPEMTTQEFIESMRGSALLRSEDKEKLKDFLTHCDMIKFAKYSATQLEMIDSFKMVEDFVDQTRKIETEEENI